MTKLPMRAGSKLATMKNGLNNAPRYIKNAFTALIHDVSNALIVMDSYNALQTGALKTRPIERSEC